MVKQMEGTAKKLEQQRTTNLTQINLIYTISWGTFFPLQCSFSLPFSSNSDFIFPPAKQRPRKTNRSMHKNNESTPKTKLQRENTKKSKTETGLAKNLEAGLFGNKLKLKNHKNKKWIKD
jgi:hypothetical protein